MGSQLLRGHIPCLALIAACFGRAHSWVPTRVCRKGAFFDAAKSCPKALVQCGIHVWETSTFLPLAG